MSVKIAYLNDYPEVIPGLAKIWYEVLGSIWLSDITIEQVEAGFYAELNKESLPLTLIALKDAQVIGAVSLHKSDEVRPDLTPWLESLVVAKAYQKQGVGKLLVDQAKQRMSSMLFDKLYLFAFDPGLALYYEQLGFKPIGVEVFNMQTVMIMEATL
ncbi:MAG: GNAT family N-acetyltransferase [Legionellaceae bacterium]|nr:GNAT family N-acetyltransferase [Legionellaceae bacterium]